MTDAILHDQSLHFSERCPRGRQGRATYQKSYVVTDVVLQPASQLQSQVLIGNSRILCCDCFEVLALPTAVKATHLNWIDVQRLLTASRRLGCRAAQLLLSLPARRLAASVQSHSALECYNRYIGIGKLTLPTVSLMFVQRCAATVSLRRSPMMADIHSVKGPGCHAAIEPLERTIIYRRKSLSEDG